MSDSFEVFLDKTISNKEHLNADAILQCGLIYLKTQLQDYLKTEGTTALTISDAIYQGRKRNNSETDKHFWCALESFYLAVGDSIDHKTKQLRWLRFVNIIEDLQGYSGSQLINDKCIKSKRVKRLCLAYTLTWEHLRYIAGNEDDYNPSELVISYFSDAFEHDHE